MQNPNRLIYLIMHTLQASSESSTSQVIKDTSTIKKDTVKKKDYYFAYKYLPVHKEVINHSQVTPSFQLKNEKPVSFDFYRTFNAYLKSNYKILKPVLTSESTGTDQQPTRLICIPKNSLNTFNSLTFIILIIGLSLLANIKMIYWKYFSQMLESVYNFQMVNKLHRDKNSIDERMNYYLNFIFAITIALFITHSLKLFHIHISGSNDYYILASIPLFILLLFFYRFVVNKIIGFVFLKQALFSEYLYNTFLTYKILGIFLIIPTIAISFLDDPVKVYFFWIGLSIIIILYIMRLWRGVVIIMKNNVLLFYLILYLCTVEFLPIVILYKFSKSYFLM